MPTTANFGLRYPALTNAPDVPTDIKNLADDVDGALAAQDSGLLSNLGWAMGANWSLNESLHRIINGVMFVRFYFQRTGAQLVGSAVGNVGDETIATLTDSAMWPQLFWVVPVRFSNTGGTVQLSDTTGVLALTDLHTNGVVNTGDNGQLSLCYPLP